MRPDARQAVREIYDAVGEHGSQAPRGMDLATGRALAKSLGYPREALDTVPASILDAFVGAGPLAALATPRPGQVVLDVGCGAGLDSYLAACAGARVVSMDPSRPMLRRLERATGDAARAGVFTLQAEAPHLPLADRTADWVWLNGVANLVPDRPHLCVELARVTRRGGGLLLADVFATAPLPEGLEDLPEAWAWCVAGAGSPGDWSRQLSATGFVDLRVSRHEEFPPFIRGVLAATRG